MDQRLTDYLQCAWRRQVQELMEFVRFASVSAQPQYAREMRACAQWLVRHLRGMGLEAALHATDAHPIVVGRSKHDPRLPTVLVYGHYDVQPPEPLELWRRPPFRPVIWRGKLYGRGASDNKGQIFAHIKAVEAYCRTSTPLPVNVIFLIEGEEETGSGSLLRFVRRHARQLRADFIVISDSGMYSKRHPTLTYATRGCVAMEIRVDGPSRDLHSGVFGGTVANPAQVLARLLASCVDERGHIAIAGFYDDVRPLAAWERRAWRRLPFDARRYRKFLGVPALDGEAGYTPLEQRWARPTFEINGLTSGYQGPGTKTIIPAWASAKITCRLVPDQQPQRILQLVRRHLRRHCPPSVRLTMSGEGSPPFFTAPDGVGAQAAQAALRQAFGCEPVCVREGGTLPILSALQRHLRGEVLMMGLGLEDDNWHAPNERFDLGNFRRGIRMSVALLQRLGAAGARQP